MESLRGNCFNGFFDAAYFERVVVKLIFFGAKTVSMDGTFS